MTSNTSHTASRTLLDDFEYVLSKVKDGNVFEVFAQDLLCQILGITFTPLGGQQDRGMDGLEGVSWPTGTKNTLYQISIEVDAKAEGHHRLKAVGSTGA